MLAKKAQIAPPYRPDDCGRIRSHNFAGRARRRIGSRSYTGRDTRPPAIHIEHACAQQRVGCDVHHRGLVPKPAHEVLDSPFFSLSPLSAPAPRRPSARKPEIVLEVQWSPNASAKGSGLARNAPSPVTGLDTVLARGEKQDYICQRQEFGPAEQLVVSCVSRPVSYFVSPGAGIGP